MKRMTLVHERDSHGEDSYRIGAATSNSVPDNEEHQNKPRAEVRDSAKDAKEDEKRDEIDGQGKTSDGDKDKESKDDSAMEIKQAESADGDGPHST
jgi:H+-transporting ATPase